MGERKVVNKYYPPDFDPSKIPRRRRKIGQQIKVRMMLPMNARCKTCGTYIYEGTKFNSKKEDVIGDTYLGLNKFRFYLKCTNCSAELVIVTDPQNNDYEAEAGATRNFEPWRDQELEEQPPSASLENRMLDSKREEDMLATLDELRSMKSRQCKVSVDLMLAATQRRAEAEAEQMQMQQDQEEDEALIRSIFQVRKIHDDDDDDDHLSVKKRKLCDQVASIKPPTITFNVTKKPVNGLQLLCQYVDDDE